MTIRLERLDGKLRLRVGLASDADDSPSEHEGRHRRLLGQLLGDLGTHRVERERLAKEPVVT